MKILGSCECCGILCCILLRVPCDQVMWKYVLYTSLCGRHSDIVLYFSACSFRSVIKELCFLFPVP